MNLPFSLTHRDAGEMLAGSACIVRTLGLIQGLQAFLFATGEHLSDMRRGNGNYPEKGKQRIWFKLNFLKHIYEYSRRRNVAEAIEHFDAIIKGPTTEFIGQFIPPSRNLTKDVVLNRVWPGLVDADYNVVAEAPLPKGDSASLHVTRCFINEVVRDIGLTHLGSRICYGDFIFWENYHPNVTFSRTKTLLAGDDFCDHTLTWTD